VLAALGVTVERARARPERRLPRGLAGRRRPHEPDGVLDCRNSGTSLSCAPACSRAWLPYGPGRRRFIAEPSGGPYHRTAALDGRGAVRASFRSLPPLVVIGHHRSEPSTSRPACRAPRSSRRFCWRACAPKGARRCARRLPRETTLSGCSGPAASRSGGSRRRLQEAARWPGLSTVARDFGRWTRSSGRSVGGCLLARRGGNPPRRRVDPASRWRQPTRRAAIDLLTRMGARSRRRRSASPPKTRTTRASRWPI